MLDIKNNSPSLLAFKKICNTHSTSILYVDNCYTVGCFFQKIGELQMKKLLKATGKEIRKKSFPPLLPKGPSQVGGRGGNHR
jgi:hypothetical protein